MDKKFKEFIDCVKSIDADYLFDFENANITAKEWIIPINTVVLVQMDLEILFIQKDCVIDYLPKCNYYSLFPNPTKVTDLFREVRKDFTLKPKEESNKFKLFILKVKF